MSEAPPAPGDSLGPSEPEAPTADDVEDTSGEPDSSDTSTLSDILTASEPNPPLREVGDLRSVRENWQAYGLRAVLKMTGADDSWAVVDAMKALVGGLMEIAEGHETDDDESSEQTPLDDDLAALGGAGGA